MIFRNEILNEQLETRGYVVIPFFNGEEIARLKALYDNYRSTSPYFHSTTFSKDVAFKQILNEKGTAIFAAKGEELLAEHKKLGISFLTKPGGEGGHMPIHQDWTIVDENKYGSYTIWVPLQDVNEDNGAITVLDGSHRLTPTLRAPSLPVVIKDIEPAIKNKMRTLRMKAGEAFIFNHALVHASHLNHSGVERVAVTYGLVPQQAQLYFYHLNADGSTDKYEVADDFFLHYDNHGERPAFVQPKETINETYSQLTFNQLDDFCLAYKRKTMKPLFKDPKLQQQYDTEGYVLVDLLNAEQVKELKEYYATLDNNHIPSYGFHVSLDNKSADFVTTVMGKIKSVITQTADKIFADYQIFTSSFVVKESNPIGVVPPHQDWSFTEEEDGFDSATVWTALVETNLYNGAMGVIVGSHKFFDHHRASPAPQFKTPLDTHVFSIFPYLKLLAMQPGQALIFNNKTVHASPPNVSDNVRLAVGFGVTQKEAPLRHFYLDPTSGGKKLLKYEADDYFFTHYNNARLSEMYSKGETPTDLKYLGTVENTVQDISADALTEKIKAAGNQFNIEMVEHLAKLFNYNVDGSKKEEPKQEAAQPESVQQPVQQAEPVNTDGRTFFQKYTPLNIIREIKHRVLQ